MGLETLENLINQIGDDDRTDVFQTGFSEQFIYYDLTLPETSTVLEQNILNREDKRDNEYKSIKKLRCCVSINFTKSALHIDTKKAAALYIVYQDGSKQVKTVAGEANILTLLTELEKNGASRKDTFQRMGEVELNWLMESVESVYKYNTISSGQNIDGFYYQGHQNMLQALVDLIDTHDLEHLNVVDAGCGRGELLKMTAHQFQNMPVEACYFGFDFNEENIKVARRNTATKSALNPKSTPEQLCHFEVANLLMTNTLIQQKKSEAILQRNWPTVFFLSGALTRLVLKDGFEALRVLQECALAQTDYLVGCGVGEPLINHFIAKRVGYKPIHTSIPHGGMHKFFSYQKMTEEEILANKRRKINKKNILDLSLAPNPVELLCALKSDIKNNMILDLSFCQLSDSLQATLYELMRAHKGIKLIYWHHDIGQLQDFIHSFSWCTFTIRNTHVDSYLMAPRSFFVSMQKGLGLFDNSLNNKENMTNISAQSLTEKITQALTLLHNLTFWERNSVNDAQECILKYFQCHLGYDGDAVAMIKNAMEPLLFSDNPKANTKNYIQNLINKQMTGNATLEEDLFLLVTYQFGISYFATRNGYPYTEYALTPNRAKEVELYNYLANKYNQQVDVEEIKALSDWRESLDPPKTTLSNLFHN
ncbi:methyltransferase domain-containing protein [Legionella sainthelensi]|uniref:methyltransferase domain-containing protein n=1 Tax=Legionella sainthelensi TaxID=28087 RepID=UPI001358613B|nr:class I SAM-dependent methyltransferase [Legionella sainthelensi]